MISPFWALKSSVFNVENERISLWKKQAVFLFFLIGISMRLIKEIYPRFILMENSQNFANLPPVFRT